jgi:hypothetical protein
MDTQVLFLKIERLRRLFTSERLKVRVSRGADGSFGLGLSDDNEVLKMHHETNAGLICPGDQILAVEGVALARERLSAVLAARFTSQASVLLDVSRRLAYGSFTAAVGSSATSAAARLRGPSARTGRAKRLLPGSAALAHAARRRGPSARSGRATRPLPGSAALARAGGAAFHRPPPQVADANLW